MLREILVDLDALAVRVGNYEERSFGKELAVDRVVAAPEPERTVYLSGYTPSTAAGFGFAGKVNLYGVSLLGGNLQGSRSGGLLGSWLTRLGVVGVELRGACDDPQILLIDEQARPSLRPLSAYGRGIAGTSQLARALYARHGRGVALALCDPASTGFRYNALVCNARKGAAPSRAAARGSTLLGRNGLIGLVVAPCRRPLHGADLDRRGLGALQRSLSRRRANAALRGSDDPAQPALGGTWGAAARVRLEQGHGLCNLFRDAHVPPAAFQRLLPERTVRQQLALAAASGVQRRPHSCLPGCPNRCAQVVLLSDGQGGARALKAGEWETCQGLINLGVYEGLQDLAATVLAHSNEHAYDHIEALVTLAALALASEAGTDTGVRFGDRACVMAALQQAVAGRTELGRLIRYGAREVERCCGLERHFTVGGHALPFHNPRSLLQTGVGLSWTYGRHGECCAGPGRHNFLGRSYDPADHGLPAEEHVLNAVHGMVLYGALDAADHCFFSGPSLGALADMQLLWEGLGLRFDVGDALRRSACCIQRIHAFNAERGVRIQALPQVFYQGATRGCLQGEDEAVRFDIPFEVVRDAGARALDDVAAGRVGPPRELLEGLEREGRRIH